MNKNSYPRFIIFSLAIFLLFGCEPGPVKPITMQEGVSTAQVDIPTTIPIPTSTLTLIPTPTQEPTPDTRPELLFTFQNGTCDYTGPDSVNAGKVKLTISIQEENVEAAAIIVATIDSKKTIDDLKAWPISEPPSWLNPIAVNEIYAGLYEKEFGLVLRPGLMYFVCFSADSKVGALGPLEVLASPAQTAIAAPTSIARIAPTVSPHPLPVIIDTDMAVDDWMAILYLLNRTDIEIKAITVTGTGEAHCGPGVDNALKLIKLAGKSQIPVACGRQTPLAGTHSFPQSWRSFVDGLAGQVLPDGQNPVKNVDANSLLANVLANSAEAVTIVTLGPLTNIADLLHASPQIALPIKIVYIMGGAIDVPGNLGTGTENVSAEWNIYIDPVAANDVIGSGIPITLVPLDVTNQAPLSMDFYARLENDHPSPEAAFVYDVLTANLSMIQSGSYYFWDPLAAAVLSDEPLVTIEKRNVCVFTQEDNNSGATRTGLLCPQIRVASRVDKDKFEQLFLDTLNSP
jgi:inosine-uridine nucleoside N-ribohydrolase